MKVQCSHCQEIIQIDDRDVKSYVSRLNNKVVTPKRIESCRANAKKPRPGAKGKKKPRKATLPGTSGGQTTAQKEGTP